MKIKLYIFCLLIGILFSHTAHSQPYIINTIVGNGNLGYSGNEGAATAAELGDPVGVALDDSGNIYIADAYTNLIRKVNKNGIISIIAGNDSAGYKGDGGEATSAELNHPYGVAVDKSGNIYIADQGNYVVRKVEKNGVISTFAGNDSAGYSGDGGAATAARLNSAWGVAVDTSGNVYIADNFNSVVRKVNNEGIISTFAGNGKQSYSGDGGEATSASLYAVYGVALDANGNVYIADLGNNVIRKVNTKGIISTFAGQIIGGYDGDGGPASSALLDWPTTVAADTLGNVYIDDYYNNVIRKVNTSGIISTISGNGYEAGSGKGAYSGDGGPADSAELNLPWGVAVNLRGNVYIADQDNSRIRELIDTANTTTSIIQLPTSNNKIIVFPNPTNGVTNISSETNIDDIKVTNLLGQLIYEYHPQKTNFAFDFKNVGIYFVTITEENEISTSKVIVIK